MNFRDATSVTEQGAGVFSSEIVDGWDIQGNANGGYLLALAGRALQEATGRPDPATITAHYLAPGPAGDISISTDIVKEGKRFATATARLEGERPILQVLGTFTDLGLSRTPDPTIERVEGGPPAIPAVDQCQRVLPGEGFPPHLMGNLDLRLHPDDDFYEGPSGDLKMRGWLKLADESDWDTIGLLLAADALPPTVFNGDMPVAWVPTVELTVHVRARPVPGWLRCNFTSRFVTGGYVEEDGEMWDESGQLVAQSRQIALVPRSPEAAAEGR